MGEARAFRVLVLVLALVSWAPIAAAQGTSADASGWFEGAGAPALERGGPPEADASGWYDAGASELDATEVDASDADPRALTEFRTALDPYGDWHQHARYGLVWVPSRQVVGNDFAPYLSRGHWALDTGGSWIWVSDYPFGSVVFHYGRWAWVTGLGWAWIPGYLYSPAWVMWRVPAYGGAYLGWAPMPPSYVWVDGYAFGVGFYMTTPWVFCPSYYAFSHHVHHHRVADPDAMREAARHTHPYRPPTGQNGPPPKQAGVPASRVPLSRVVAPAAPGRADAEQLRSFGSWSTADLAEAGRRGPQLHESARSDRTGGWLPRSASSSTATRQSTGAGRASDFSRILRTPSDQYAPRPGTRATPTLVPKTSSSRTGPVHGAAPARSGQLVPRTTPSLAPSGRVPSQSLTPASGGRIAPPVRSAPYPSAR